jgi:hypothetical protein
MSDEIQEPGTSHVWWYRAERTSKPVQHEFGMPMAKQDASNAIAKLHGLKELDSGAVVSMKKLEQLPEKGADMPEPSKPEPKKA